MAIHRNPPVSSSGGSSGSLARIPALPDTGITAAQQSMIWTGLAGNTDGGYKCTWNIKANGTPTFGFQINGSGANIQGVRFYWASIPGGNNMDATAMAGWSGAITSGHIVRIEFEMSARVTGLPRLGTMKVNKSDAAGAGVSYLIQNVIWNDLVSEITSFGLVGDIATGIAIGSNATLYAFNQ